MSIMDYIIKTAYEEKNFWVVFGNFLDEFKHSNQETRLKIISEMPDFDGFMVKEADYNNAIGTTPYYEIPLKRQLSYLAATVHKLANDNNLPVPEWVLDDKYILDEPYYFCDTKNKEYQAYLQKDSPAEFKSKNIYMNSDVLSRC